MENLTTEQRVKKLEEKTEYLKASFISLATQLERTTDILLKLSLKIKELK